MPDAIAHLFFIASLQVLISSSTFGNHFVFSVVFPIKRSYMDNIFVATHSIPDFKVWLDRYEKLDFQFVSGELEAIVTIIAFNIRSVERSSHDRSWVTKKSVNIM
ncbi:unnamed protein product [Prunus armeniaca]